MGDNALTSENALSHNNLRAYSPQTTGGSRLHPDTVTALPRWPTRSGDAGTQPPQDACGLRGHGRDEVGDVNQVVDG
jgi:hypothetical protein